MPRHPIIWRIILACFLALMLCRSSLDACTGDQYWKADREGTLTWYKRGPDIPVRLPLDTAFDVVRQALQNASLPSCDAPEKDLIAQKVKVIRAFRTDAVHTRIPAGYVSYQDYSQVMVRIVSHSGNDSVAEILTRTKRGTGNARPSKVADELPNCGAAAIAEKVRTKLVALASTR